MMAKTWTNLARQALDAVPVRTQPRIVLQMRASPSVNAKLKPTVFLSRVELARVPLVSR